MLVYLLISFRFGSIFGFHGPLIWSLFDLTFIYVKALSGILPLVIRRDPLAGGSLMTYARISALPLFFKVRSHLLSHFRSTIGRIGLNRRVRDGNGCLPDTHRHEQ